MLPKQEQLRIVSLHLVPISRDTALVVVVTDGGIMRDAFVQVSEALDRGRPLRHQPHAHRQAAPEHPGRAQRLMHALARSMPGDPQVLNGIAQLAAQLEKQSASDSLKVWGAHCLLNYPEYRQVDKARAVLTALGQTESLLALMKDGAQMPLNVSIGPENGISQMQELSIVTASYELGRGHRGAIGLIGPTRMPYAKLLSTLSVASHTLSRLLTSQEYN